MLSIIVEYVNWLSQFLLSTKRLGRLKTRCFCSLLGNFHVRSALLLMSRGGFYVSR